MAGVVILVAVLLGTSAIALGYRRRNGRIRGTVIARPSDPGMSAVDAALADVVPTSGARVTLVQFSTSFCAPCRATRRILGEIAQVVPGVVHLEIDAESHLEAVRALDIRRTPTTLILDKDRHIVARASGQPKRDEVMATLGRILEPVT